MKIYIASLAVGILVGIIYSLLNVRSPAPPTWALVGLLGMLAGEQLIPYAKQHIFNRHVAIVQSASKQVDKLKNVDKVNDNES